MPKEPELARRATYEDLLRVPDHLVAEIVDGELYTSPRPALRHALAGSSLGDELVAPFQKGRGGPGGWWILDEPELHLASDILVPDLAGWRRGRLPVVPDEPYLTLAPDWLAEILSPSTARLDRVKKLNAYAREQVAHVWLLDPGTRILEVLALEQGRWVIHATFGQDERVRAAPFDAIEIDLAELWGERAEQQP
jgi:Uma2 family endonuclease